MRGRRSAVPADQRLEVHHVVAAKEQVAECPFHALVGDRRLVPDHADAGRHALGIQPCDAHVKRQALGGEIGPRARPLGQHQRRGQRRCAARSPARACAPRCRRANRGGAAPAARAGGPAGAGTRLRHCTRSAVRAQRVRDRARRARPRRSAANGAPGARGWPRARRRCRSPPRTRPRRRGARRRRRSTRSPSRSPTRASRGRSPRRSRGRRARSNGPHCSHHLAPHQHAEADGGGQARILAAARARDAVGDGIDVGRAVGRSKSVGHAGQAEDRRAVGERADDADPAIAVAAAQQRPSSQPWPTSVSELSTTKSPPPASEPGVQGARETEVARVGDDARAGRRAAKPTQQRGDARIVARVIDEHDARALAGVWRARATRGSARCRRGR